MTSPTTDDLAILENGAIQMEGLIPWGSNYTFLVNICHDEQGTQAIYKPRQGERPLWDFSRGTLCLRERAAYLVSEAIGWGLVPLTILRDGPQGWGSVQQFIPHDPEETYFNLQGKFIRPLQRFALFDTLINNADRKGGHIIRDDDDRLWGIDHGICFHTEYKLRTVIWDFAGQRIPEPLLTDLCWLQQRLEDRQNALSQELAELLKANERRALLSRLTYLIKQRHFVEPGAGRHYPWPLV